MNKKRYMSVEITQTEKRQTRMRFISRCPPLSPNTSSLSTSQRTWLMTRSTKEIIHLRPCAHGLSSQPNLDSMYVHFRRDTQNLSPFKPMPIYRWFEKSPDIRNIPSQLLNLHSADSTGRWWAMSDILFLVVVLGIALDTRCICTCLRGSS